MAFHENFWVMIGAAAPVIALAAIVAVGDSARTRGDLATASREYEAARLADSSTVVAKAFRRRILLKYLDSAQQINLGVQAVALAISLLSVAYQRNLIPPPAATVLVVIGLAVLAVVSVLGGSARRFADYIRWVAQGNKAPRPADLLNVIGDLGRVFSESDLQQDPSPDS